MKKESIQISYKKFQHIDELSDDDCSLLKHAISASENAYSPYSEFCVGAAVKLENGEIVIGSNQENAAFPSGLCAERVAIFSASAQYATTNIHAIAVYAAIEDTEDLLSPCGACRQVLSEYELKQDNDIRIIISSKSGGGLVFDDTKALLPFAFKLKRLKKR